MITLKPTAKEDGETFPRNLVSESFGEGNDMEKVTYFHDTGWVGFCCSMVIMGTIFCRSKKMWKKLQTEVVELPET